MPREKLLDWADAATETVSAVRTARMYFVLFIFDLFQEGLRAKAVPANKVTQKLAIFVMIKK